jgi:hypothetical protein
MKTCCMISMESPKIDAWYAAQNDGDSMLSEDNVSIGMDLKVILIGF